MPINIFSEQLPGKLSVPMLNELEPSPPSIPQYEPRKLDRSEQIQELAINTINNLQTERAASRASKKNWAIGCMAKGVTGTVLILKLLSSAYLGLIAIPGALFLIGCILLLTLPSELSEDDVEQIKKLFEDLLDPKHTDHNLARRCSDLGIDYRQLGLKATNPFEHPIKCEQIKREAEANLGKAALKYGYAKLCEHIPEIKLLRANLALEILNRNNPLEPIVEKHSMDGLKALDLSPVLVLRYKNDRSLLDAYVSPTGKMTEAQFEALVEQIPQLKDLFVDRLRELIQDPNTDIGPIVKKHTVDGLIKFGLKHELVQRYKTEALHMHYGEIVDQVGLKFIRENQILTPKQRLQKWEQWKNDAVIRNEWYAKIQVPSIDQLLENGFITSKEAEKWSTYFELENSPIINFAERFQAQDAFYESVGLKMDPKVRIDFRTEIAGMTFAEFMNEYMPEKLHWKDTKLVTYLRSGSSQISSKVTAAEFIQLREWYDQLTKTLADKRMFVAAEINKEFQEKFVNVFMQEPNAPEN